MFDPEAFLNAVLAQSIDDLSVSGSVERVGHESDEPAFDVEIRYKECQLTLSFLWDESRYVFEIYAEHDIAVEFTSDSIEVPDDTQDMSESAVGMASVEVVVSRKKSADKAYQLRLGEHFIDAVFSVCEEAVDLDEMFSGSAIVIAEPGGHRQLH